MNSRITLARAVDRLGHFISSLPVAIMKPNDLAEFNRQTYQRQQEIDSWSDQRWVERGLGKEEKALFNQIPPQEGQLLILGLGGGREAIAFAKMGFEVTGIDFIPQMVDMAKVNAKKAGVTITGIVQDFSQLDLPENTFDIVWISEIMYSSLPTKKQRITLLKDLWNILRPGGYVICQCAYSPERASRKGKFVRQTLAYLTLNFAYNEGDRLWNGREFSHEFNSENAFRAEVEEGGFKILYSHLPQHRQIWDGRTILQHAHKKERDARAFRE
jgi:SAM-dependent methyltransferase